MMRYRKLLGACTFLSLLAVGPLLYAGPAPDDGAAKTKEVTAPMSKQANLTPEQMRMKSDDLIKEMQEFLKRIVELQQVARKQKDVIKLNCVNDKLLQVKQLLNIAEGARTDLVEAIAQQDQAASYHHFSQITIAHEKVMGLRDEAEACIGEEILFLGPTEVTVDEPTIPDDPTGEGAELPEFERPSFATPFI